MINTTTIPTQIIQEGFSFLSSFSILSYGILFGAFIAELFLHLLKAHDRKYIGFWCGNEDSSESEESSLSEEEEEEEEDYCDKYVEEFVALPLQKLNDEELAQLNTKIVREQVAENVEVIMTFDKATDTFWYYTDHLKSVSYPILETVARKYALEHNCKIILQESASATAAAAGAGAGAGAAAAEPATMTLSKQELTEEIVETAIEQISSVFAKFKTYNAGKGSAPNFTSVIKVIEQMNHFRYRGKIVDYVERETQIEKKEEPTLDYASYKKLLEKKEK
jgi:hypothetical protein